jgi:hypothetical protein
MRSINDPEQTGKREPAPETPVRQPKFGYRAIVEPFEFADCCTMPAAVTKSLLDRLFFSRFELWN